MSRSRRGGGGLLGVLGGLLALALAGVAAAMVALASVGARGPLEDDIVFTVERGAGASAVGAGLVEAGALNAAWPFRLAIALYADDRSLQAGEYAIPAGASAREIVERIASGDAVTYAITIPEGWTTARALERIAEADMLDGPMPEIPPAEGALLPDTYVVQRGMQRADLVAQMVAARESFLAEAWAGRAADVPVRTPEEALILASVVEKETGLAAEREEVAGVFVNRLRRGMRLESDPTVIYGVCACARLTDREGAPRGLRRSELDRATPYNTYQIDGLPPGPIANPGRESILAVLNPPETRNLFFVAQDPFDPTKGHVFSETYAQHNAAVQRLRAAEAAARAAD